MSLVGAVWRDLKKDFKTAQKLKPRPSALLLIAVVVFAITLPMYFLGANTFVMPALFSMAAFGFTIALKWPLRQRPWFWVTIAMLATLHLPMILFVKWPVAHPAGPYITPFAVADMLVMLVVLNIVAQFTVGKCGTRLPRKT